MLIAPPMVLCWLKQGTKSLPVNHPNECCSYYFLPLQWTLPSSEESRKSFKEREKSLLPEEPWRLGSNAYSSRKWNACLNFIRLTTVSLLMLNTEQQWRQAITVYSSGHALKERTIFLSSISFERIQKYVFYKIFQDFEFSSKMEWEGEAKKNL